MKGYLQALSYQTKGLCFQSGAFYLCLRIIEALFNIAVVCFGLVRCIVDIQTSRPLLAIFMAILYL